MFPAVIAECRHTFITCVNTPRYKLYSSSRVYVCKCSSALSLSLCLCFCLTLSLKCSPCPPTLPHCLLCYNMKSAAVLFKAKKLTEEELNALIAHAHRRVEQLQRQLAEQMAMETQRLEKALLQQKSEDEQLAVQKLNAEAESLREEFLVEKERWVRKRKKKYCFLVKPEVLYLRKLYKKKV